MVTNSCQGQQLVALVNDGGAFLAGRVAPDQLFTFLASYLVLFALALYSRVQGKRQRDRKGV
jgi:hypothetical protein